MFLYEASNKYSADDLILDFLLLNKAPAPISVAETSSSSDDERVQMRKLLDETSAKLIPFIEQELDALDYDGSPLYEDEIDEFFVHGVTERAIRRHEYACMSDATVSVQAVSNNNLQPLVYALVLNLLFSERRPRRKCRRHFPN